jgi:hypothetical protein
MSGNYPIKETVEIVGEKKIVKDRRVYTCPVHVE